MVSSLAVWHADLVEAGSIMQHVPDYQQIADRDCLCFCRRAYQKCPAQLTKAGRSKDAALFNTHFDVDQISDNCRFR